MNQSATAAASQIETSKTCGNCTRISFELRPEEAEVLKEKLLRYGAEIMNRWTRVDSIMRPGGNLDHEKLEARRILIEHQKFCRVSGVKIFWSDRACCRWQPI